MSSRRTLALTGALLAATAFAQEEPQETPQEETPPAQDDDPPQRDAEGETGEHRNLKPGSTAAPRFAGSLDDFAAKHTFAKVSAYGASRGGRPLRLLTLSPGGDDVDWKALVVAGLHGTDSVWDAQLALDVAAVLAERAAEIPPRTAFLFVLDGSPDATAYAASKSGARRAGNDTPTDEDQDGDVDEDGPDDLDGDGRISWLRVPDPAGAFAAADPKTPNAMPPKADPAKGKVPAWRIVPEGRDDDGDGLLNEDAPGGPIVGRNFPVLFEEHVPTAGRWAASEPETRALMDLLLADEEVAAVLELGPADTLAAPPEWPAGAAKLPDDDAKLLEGLRVLWRGEEKPAAPEKTEPAKPKPHAVRAGSLGMTTLHQLGRIWAGRATRQPLWPDGDDAPAVQEWRKAEGAGLPAGAEIAVLAAPGPQFPAHAESARAAQFLLTLAKQRAKPEFTKTTTSGEPGVLRIETRLANAARLPTHTQRGADTRGRRPLNVRVVLPQGGSLVAGKPLVQIERIAAGAESQPMRWVVAGPSGAAVTIECTGPDTGTTRLEARIP